MFTDYDQKNFYQEEEEAICATAKAMLFLVIGEFFGQKPCHSQKNNCSTDLFFMTKSKRHLRKSRVHMSLKGSISQKYNWQNCFSSWALRRGKFQIHLCFRYAAPSSLIKKGPKKYMEVSDALVLQFYNKSRILK